VSSREFNKAPHMLQEGKLLREIHDKEGIMLFAEENTERLVSDIK
jgi:hypothetical protein